jgi:hypothetical protein
MKSGRQTHMRAEKRDALTCFIAINCRTLSRYTCRGEGMQRRRQRNKEDKDEENEDNTNERG